MWSLPSPRQYQLKCEEWKLALHSESELRLYKGLGAAIGEIAIGLAQFLPHKRSVAWVKGQSPWLEVGTSYFFREGYECTQVSWNGFPSPASFVEGLKKDTALVMYCEDHCITDEKFNFDELDRLLNEKKIFSIRVSHKAHLFDSETPKLRPFSVRIYGVHPDLAFGVFGDRYRVPAGVCATQVFSEKPDLLQKKISFKDEIKNFESQLPKGWSAMSLKENRLHSQSMIYNPEVGGDYILSLLPEMCVATLHECFFDGYQSYKNWWEPMPRPEVTRGSLVIPGELLKNPMEVKKLMDALSQASAS